jgi:hypothetical protein
VPTDGSSGNERDHGENDGWEAITIDPRQPAMAIRAIESIYDGTKLLLPLYQLSLLVITGQRIALAKALVFVF